MDINTTGEKSEPNLPIVVCLERGNPILMDQLKPKMIIPTSHVSQTGITLAVEKWKGYVYTETGGVMISRADIPAELSILIFGPLAFAYQSMFNLPSW